ncbi:Citrate lyase acyl carrier protein [Caballeronia sp. SBC1]|uniref:citrate lyase acyl carrier protein n=1 Tax=unclassified Caballeronia TaxID=2646786 RepID=UPI0013E16AAB|nr:MULTISPECIES: citrate lyase acyl carrier protein [unclassified Caballeronia]QIE25454.1 Citrate lyase acyl carrier protein [Caballeronia sp. SBC2]QIN63504.1 Citrate lyase acyl carrier protein [Caballeronia sp. SBC1]
MQIIKEAIAGSLESSDLLVNIGPAPDGKLEIVLRSAVIKQFGAQILQVVEDTLARMDVTSGSVVIEDKGALDCVIRARVQTATLRACGIDHLAWEQLS